jgi:archaellum component FlaF (FlaF/FlaG flagellin family)
VINQIFDDSCFIQDSTSYVQMAQWTIPILSDKHTTLSINIQGFCPTAANGTAKIEVIIGASTVSTEISITDQNRYISSFNSGTVTVTGSTQETAVVRMSVKAPSGQEVTILGVQANWQALTSPLTTGSFSQGSDSFIPQGVGRLGADLPLTARFGVETIENINTLRARGRILFSWSGVEGASSSGAISAAGAPPRAIGVGDLSSFYAPAAIFSGTTENQLKVKVYVRALNIASSADHFTINIMNNALAITTGGWSEFDIDLTQDELSISDQFGLSVYRAGVDEDNDQVASPSRLPSATGYVAGLVIIGV